MDLPIYQPYFSSKDNFKGGKSFNKDTQETLLSEESQSIIEDKKDNFWQSLRKLWNGHNTGGSSQESNTDHGIIEGKINNLLILFGDVEANVNLLDTKVNKLELKINKYDDICTNRKMKGIAKNIQKVYKKSILQKDKCTHVKSKLEALQKNINECISGINILKENDSDDLITVSSSEITAKFQSWLDNILSDISSESLMQWNDMLQNFYSKKIKKSNKNGMLAKKCSKSPGESLINCLRRSERIQNKTNSNTRIRNTKHSIIFKNVVGKIGKINGLSEKSTSIKIFKYYEESTNEKNATLSVAENFEHDSAAQLIYDQCSKHRNIKQSEYQAQDYDSDFETVSLRKLFNC